MERPPLRLHIQGRPEALQLFRKLPERGLAIVGSREAQARSRQTLSSALTPLRGFDWVIVSGLARGVDAWAHEQALKLGFPTIAILGCGLNVAYPAENQDLRRRILSAGGLVVTELESDHEPVPWAFLHRNRLIAAWSKATWVVQAGFRSGALNTASWALAHEKALFATPHYPEDPTMAGNQRLLVEETAHCVWNSRSFGRVWLEIESFLASTHHYSTPQNNDKSIESMSDKAVLAQEIQRRMAEEGGFRVTELIGWALERGWSTERFFAAHL